jgi:hypothetical protein
MSYKNGQLRAPGREKIAAAASRMLVSEDEQRRLRRSAEVIRYCIDETLEIRD